MRQITSKIVRFSNLNPNEDGKSNNFALPTELR